MISITGVNVSAAGCSSWWENVIHPLVAGQTETEWSKTQSVGRLGCSSPVNPSVNPQLSFLSLTICTFLSFDTMIKWDYITAAGGVLSAHSVQAPPLKRDLTSKAGRVLEMFHKPVCSIINVAYCCLLHCLVKSSTVVCQWVL